VRKRQKSGGLTVHCISGTHVVLMGFDLSEARRKGCLGFAVQREDHTEDERYWMTGAKTFAVTDPGVGPGGQVSSREHPYQTFQWADYSAKPEHDYTYTVIPLYGRPDRLETRGELPVRVTTEKEIDGKHSIFFNRGAIASQEYARRFLNQRPDQLEGDQQVAAYKWLSRGLFEAMLQFFDRAKDSSYGLYGAVYEFKWPAALDAIGKAHRRGAHVRIVYDATKADNKKANESAIRNAGIKSICAPRTTGKLMHNKFFVLTKDDRPVAVWTGSTNLTENGIFGHLNFGHIVTDAGIATQYLQYWTELGTNPDAQAERDWMTDNNPAPPDPWSAKTTALFSPHSGLAVLKWYAQIADSAKKALFMTFPFGMDKNFQRVFEQDDGVLRYALMEKEGNGAGLAQGKIDIKRIRALPNVIVAVGNSIAINSFDRWLKEAKQATEDANVRYVHTKYMLVDPLGENPLVIAGSANFSGASTNVNNENMLVIRDDQRLTDICLGEFMRLHAHYAFREAVAQKWGGQNWNPSHLDPTAIWQKDYFTDRKDRCYKRVYFAG
jgi:phosphatidylserine/phosphatidylglycerophosphate/cardiolipin synthase-like enzyme